MQAATKAKVADNVAHVLLTPDPCDLASHQDLVEVLEAKYDALRDKLLADALIKQVGEDI